MEGANRQRKTIIEKQGGKAELIPRSYQPSSIPRRFIRTTDEHLWEHAPSHAYALLGFTAIDIILFATTVLKQQPAIRIVSLWGFAQVLVILLDVLTAPEFGFSYYEFAADLYGNWFFDALLVTRLLQAVSPHLLSTMRIPRFNPI